MYRTKLNRMPATHIITKIFQMETVAFKIGICGFRMSAIILDNIGARRIFMVNGNSSGTISRITANPTKIPNNLYPAQTKVLLCRKIIAISPTRILLVKRAISTVENEKFSMTFHPFYLLQIIFS